MGKQLKKLHIYALTLGALVLGFIHLTPSEWASADDATGKTSTNVLIVDKLKRQYDLYVPISIKSSQLNEVPLLVVLHGGGPFTNNVKHLGFNQLADLNKVIIAYPKAYKPKGRIFHYGWNDGRGTTTSAKMGIDDVKFVTTAVSDISSRYPIANKRIYVTGASNGGMMAYHLGCKASQVFSGIAPVIANLPQPLAQLSPFDRRND